MGWQLFFIPLFFGHFRFSSYLCTINTGNGSCFERRSVSRYDGFQCSFWAAAVGYAIRFVFCSSTVAALFLCVLSACLFFCVIVPNSIHSELLHFFFGRFREYVYLCQPERGLDAHTPCFLAARWFVGCLVASFI